MWSATLHIPPAFICWLCLGSAVIGGLLLLLMSITSILNPFVYDNTGLTKVYDVTCLAEIATLCDSWCSCHDQKLLVLPLPQLGYICKVIHKYPKLGVQLLQQLHYLV